MGPMGHGSVSACRCSGKLACAVTISIVLATYNGARFIQQQLDSYLTQDRLPDELVVSDDGSSDATLQIVQKFASSSPFPVKVKAGPGQGLAANFLSTTEVASGDYIAFSDQDDVWLPGKLAILEKALKDGGSLAFHGATPVDAALHPIRTGYRNTRRSHAWGPLEPPVWRSLPGNTMLFDRRLLDGVDWHHRPAGQWAPGTLLHHDDLVALLAATRGRTTRLPDRAILYRQHGGNAAGAPEHAIFSNQRWSGGYSGHVRLRAEVARTWAEWFAPLGLPGRQKETAAYFCSAAMVQARRAETLEATGLATWSMYLHHVLAGDYRTNTPAGLGWRSLLRDGYVLGRRALK